MRNKNINYVRVHIGDVLLLVPTVREREMGMENEMLWSLKEFDYKVFGYMNVDYVIASIINQKAAAGLPFYDIDMDMYNPETYPENIGDICKVGWDYAVMRLTHLYFDQIIKNYPENTPSNLAITCQWHSNSHQALQIYPLDDTYLAIGDQEKMGILFSSYNTYSEEYLEELLIKSGNCQKMEKNFQEWKPEKFEYPKILSEHLIKRSNSFFLLKDGEIYCGMDLVNHNILLKVNWRCFASEMIHPKGCSECNPGYKMRVEVPKRELKLFKHSLHKDYFKNVGNDCYSVTTQLINIIHSQWKRIKRKVKNVEWVIFERKYDDSRDGKGDYIVVQYLDKDWKELKVQEISIKYDNDYIVEKKAKLAKLF